MTLYQIWYLHICIYLKLMSVFSFYLPICIMHHIIHYILLFTETRKRERTSIFKLHYYIIVDVDTIVWIICEAKQYSEDRDESALDIVSIMKVSHPSSCIMQGIVLLWSSSSSWVFTKFDHIITRIRCSEDDIQYRLISTFRYTFLFLLFLYIMDGWIYICYSIFFFWLREQPYSWCSSVPIVERPTQKSSYVHISYVGASKEMKIVENY